MLSRRADLRPLQVQVAFYYLLVFCQLILGEMDAVDIAHVQLEYEGGNGGLYQSYGRVLPVTVFPTCLYRLNVKEQRVEHYTQSLCHTIQVVFHKVLSSWPAQPAEAAKEFD